MNSPPSRRPAASTSTPGRSRSRSPNARGALLRSPLLDGAGDPKAIGIAVACSESVLEALESAIAGEPRPFREAMRGALSVVEFGRHRGFSFGEVLPRDPGYAVWALGLRGAKDAPESAGSMESFVAWLRQLEDVPEAAIACLCSAGDGTFDLDGLRAIRDNMMADPTVRFGKHSGKNMDDVWASDPDYCAYIASQTLPSLAAACLKSFVLAKCPDGRTGMDWLRTSACAAEPERKDLDAAH